MKTVFVASLKGYVTPDPRVCFTVTCPESWEEDWGLLFNC